MKRLSRLLLILLLSAVPAMAEFEGVMEMKLEMTDGDGANTGGGAIKIAIGKPGYRTEMNMMAMQMPIKMVMLMKTETPDLLYRINDEGKSYSEINVAKTRDVAAKNSDTEKFTVKKLGEEKILGYKAQHVLVMSSRSTNEMWIAKDFLDYNLFQRLQTRPGSSRGNEAIEKALKEAGAEGMPLKAIMPSPNGGKVTMEVVKADKQSLPASTFEIPAGYTKAEGPDILGGAAGAMPDDAKKRMQDAMKNMTPEQRARFEQMMKQRGVPTQ